MSHSSKLFLFKLISRCSAQDDSKLDPRPCEIAPRPAPRNNSVDGGDPLKHCFINNLSGLRLAELIQQLIKVYQVVIRWLRLLAYVVGRERDMQRSTSAPLQATPM